MRLCLLVAVLTVCVAADWSVNSALSKIKTVAKRFGFYDQSGIVTNELSGLYHPHHHKKHEHHGRHHHKHHKHEHHHKKHHRHHHRKPWFCHDNQCPHFVTVRKGKGYDVRCYHENVWVKTNAEKKDVKNFKPMFWRLFKYINGANSEKKKIKMTVPVTTTNWYNITDHTTASSMVFWLHGKCSQDNSTCAPEPIDPRVEVITTPKSCFYVRSFGGWASGRSWNFYKELWYLSKDLKRDGRKYVFGLSFFNGYDSPWKLLFRHNEAMRMVDCEENEMDCGLAEEESEDDGSWENVVA